MIPEERARTLVVMGVSGVGKSTVASLLSVELGCVFLDADDLHSPHNVAKMRSGLALSDEDRAPWLSAVGQRLEELRQSRGCVVAACSALKRSYRDVLRHYAPLTCFAHLSAPAQVVAPRLIARTAGKIAPALLATQFETLEPLEPDECGVEVDAGRSVEAVVALLVAWHDGGT